MTIVNPVGIDEQIQKLQAQFLAKLFVGKTYSSHGRAFLLSHDKGEVPEVYNGSDEYLEVLLDDTKDAISFFTVDPVIEVNGTDATAQVDIFFFVNLLTLFSYTHRAVEEVHILVLKEINNSQFRVKKLVQGFDSVKDFAIKNPELMDMQPFYCFKFQSSITYKLC